MDAPKRKKWPWILTGAALALAVLITIPVMLVASLAGRSVGSNVASFITGEQTAVVEQEYEAQFDTVFEDKAYVEGAEYV